MSSAAFKHHARIPRFQHRRDFLPSFMRRFDKHYPWRTEPCNLDNITAALLNGFDPSIQWTESDLVVPRLRGGCLVADFQPEPIPWAHWNTPLHKALKEGHFDAATLLLERGVDTNQLNAAGRTAVHEAVQWEDYETISFLARHGADLDRPSEKGIARYEDWDIDVVGVAGLLPIHHAIHIGSPRMIQALVDHEANVHLPVGADGWTPLDLALLERRDDLVNVLLGAGARWPADATTIGALPPEFNTESARTHAARRLLAFATSGIYKAGDSERGHFPPCGCRAIYRYLLSTSGVVQTQNDCNIYSNVEAPSLTLLFFDALFRAANLHVPASLADDADPLCPKCLRFQQPDFSPSFYPRTTPTFYHSPNMYDLAHTAENGCPLCAILVELLNSQGNKSRSGLPHEHQPAVRLSCSFEPHPDVRKVKVTKWEDMGKLTVTCGSSTAWLDVVHLGDGLLDGIHITDDFTLGTASPRALRMAKNWVRDCNENHEACYSRQSQEETSLPTRVIEVGDGRTQHPRILESNGRSGAFTALSYCWGSSPSLTTTKALLESHLIQLPVNKLSATVRQAIEVTRELGLRYIWIDALCIVQDDPDDWEREAARMLQVYSNATVTISASASSDASEGLFRPRGDSNRSLLLPPVRLSLYVPRVLRSYSTQVRHWYVLPTRARDFVLKDVPVDKRGWILQEQEMSTRLLHFGNGILHWACLTSSGSEADPQGLSYEHASLTYPKRQRRYAIQRWDHLGDDKEKLWKKWEELVAEYTKRNLSHASDRVPAILGLAKMMAPPLGSGNPIAGIWRSGEFGVRSLAWTAQTVGAANPCYPSWTWASTTAETGYFRLDNPRRYGAGQRWLAELIDVEITKTSVSQNYVVGVVRVKGMLGCFDHNGFGNSDPYFPNAQKLVIRKVNESTPSPTAQDLTAVASTNNKKMSAKKSRKMERKAMKKELKAMEEEMRNARHGRYFPDRNQESLYNCWFMPVAKFGSPTQSIIGPPPEAEVGSVICLCLKPVDVASRKFTRIGICEVEEADIMGSEEDIITIE